MFSEIVAFSAVLVVLFGATLVIQCRSKKGGAKKKGGAGSKAKKPVGGKKPHHGSKVS